MQLSHVRRAERAYARGDGPKAVHSVRAAGTPLDDEVRIRAAIVEASSLAMDGFMADAVSVVRGALSENPRTDLQLRLLSSVVPALGVDNPVVFAFLECLRANVDAEMDAIASGSHSHLPLVARSVDVLLTATDPQSRRWCEARNDALRAHDLISARERAEAAPADTTGAIAAPKSGTEVPRRLFGWWPVRSAHAQAGAAIAVVAIAAMLIRVMMSRLAGGGTPKPRALSL